MPILFNVRISPIAELVRHRKTASMKKRLRYLLYGQKRNYNAIGFPMCFNYTRCKIKNHCINFLSIPFQFYITLKVGQIKSVEKPVNRVWIRKGTTQTTHFLGGKPSFFTQSGNCLSNEILSGSRTIRTSMAYWTLLSINSPTIPYAFLKYSNVLSLNCQLP